VDGSVITGPALAALEKPVEAPTEAPSKEEIKPIHDYSNEPMETKI
jgi:hypothetical protein